MIEWAFAGRNFNLDDAGPWAEIEPATEIVIIGLQLDEAALRADLDACLVDDAELKAFKELVESGGGLRFDIGSKVECNLGPEQWIEGTVVAHDYIEDGWDKPAPYQVQLKDGTLIFAPIDEDWVIRASLKV